MTKMYPKKHLEKMYKEIITSNAWEYTDMCKSSMNGYAMFTKVDKGTGFAFIGLDGKHLHINDTDENGKCRFLFIESRKPIELWI